MQIRPIQHTSPEYEATLDLRRRFLREPLGLELTEADTKNDAEQHHFGIYSQNEQLGAGQLGTGQAGDAHLIGSVIGMPIQHDGEKGIRIRQMVVDEAWRGKQVGRQLLLGAEEQLAKKGYHHFELYARPEAAPFYEKCGYEPTGETELLIGILHQHYAKRVD